MTKCIDNKDFFIYTSKTKYNEGYIMNFKPLGDRLLIQRVEESNTTSSGIIIPDNAKEKPSQGKVIAIGSEVEEVKEGDTVVFGKYTGNEISIDEQEYLIVESSDVYGIFA